MYRDRDDTLFLSLFASAISAMLPDLWPGSDGRRPCPPATLSPSPAIHCLARTNDCRPGRQCREREHRRQRFFYLFFGAVGPSRLPMFMLASRPEKARQNHPPPTTLPPQPPTTVTGLHHQHKYTQREKERREDSCALRGRSNFVGRIRRRWTMDGRTGSRLCPSWAVAPLLRRRTKTKLLLLRRVCFCCYCSLFVGAATAQVDRTDSACLLIRCWYVRGAAGR